MVACPLIDHYPHSGQRELSEMYISYVTAFVPHMAIGSAESSPASLSGAPFDRLPSTGSVAANWAFFHKHQVHRAPVPWHLLFPFSENVSSQPSRVWEQADLPQGSCSFCVWCSELAGEAGEAQGREDGTQDLHFWALGWMVLPLRGQKGGG